MKKLLLLIASTAVMFWSCNSDADKKATETATDSTKVESNVDKNTLYRLPSPVEFYMFMRESKAKFAPKAMNKLENVSKYNTVTSKAMNFGVYASDLAYCTVYGQNQETFLYFSKAKQLADELGLTEGFDEKIANRIDKNINNSDSLQNITTDGYWEAVTYLESQDKSNLLPYILVGSWLESVHLAIASVQKFDANNPVVIRIAEQQLLLENLLDHLNSSADVDKLKDIISKLTDIQSSFDLLYDNTEDVMITKEQYQEITKKIETLRAEIIS